MRLLAGVDQPAAHRVELEHDVVHRLVQHFALFGEDEAARVTMEQRRAEFLFERADLTADRRLAQAQGFAGVGERTGFGRRLEDAQLVPVHPGLRPARPLPRRASSRQSPHGGRGGGYAAALRSL